MTNSYVIKTFAVATLALLAVSNIRPATAACGQRADPSAPLIGASDMRAIDKAVTALPKMAPKGPLSVGSLVPPNVKLASIPSQVVAVLPQYAHYDVVHTKKMLVIVDPGSRSIAYLLPLGQGSAVVCPN